MFIFYQVLLKLTSQVLQLQLTPTYNLIPEQVSSNSKSYFTNIKLLTYSTN